MKQVEFLRAPFFATAQFSTLADFYATKGASGKIYALSSPEVLLYADLPIVYSISYEVFLLLLLPPAPRSLAGTEIFLLTHSTTQTKQVQVIEQGAVLRLLKCTKQQFTSAYVLNGIRDRVCPSICYVCKTAVFLSHCSSGSNTKGALSHLFASLALRLRTKA